MDKFINATHLIQTLEDTKPLIDNSPVSAFQKTVCKMTLNGQFNICKKRWPQAVSSVEWFMPTGLNILKILEKASLLNARLVILAKMPMNQSSVLTVELLWTRRLSNGESSFTSWVWTFI
mgnify:CR=1 FL=1